MDKRKNLAIALTIAGLLLLWPVRLEAQVTERSELARIFDTLKNVARAETLYPVEGNIVLNIRVVASPGLHAADAAETDRLQGGDEELGRARLYLKWREEAAATLEQFNAAACEERTLGFNAEILGQESTEVYHLRLSCDVSYERWTEGKGGKREKTQCVEASLTTVVRAVRGEGGSIEIKSGDRRIILTYRLDIEPEKGRKASKKGSGPKGKND